MLELFKHMPEKIKKQDEAVINWAFQFLTVEQAKIFFSDYIHNCHSQEEKDFVTFLVAMKMEQLLNESNNDFSEESAR